MKKSELNLATDGLQIPTGRPTDPRALSGSRASLLRLSPEDVRPGVVVLVSSLIYYEE